MEEVELDISRSIDVIESDYDGRSVEKPDHGSSSLSSSSSRSPADTVRAELLDVDPNPEYGSTIFAGDNNFEELQEGSDDIRQGRGGHVASAAAGEGKAGIASSIFNLVNTTIGTGILALPYALRMSGLLSGFVLIMMVGILSNITLRLVVLSAERTQCFSYRDLAKMAFGRWFGLLVEILIICYTTGTCIACPIIIGDVLPLVLRNFVSESSFLGKSWFSIVVLMALVMFPLASQKSMRRMSFASALAITCVSFLWLTICEKYFSIYDAVNGNISITFVSTDIGFAIAIPLITAAFVSHYNSLNIYRELSNRSYRRMVNVINASTLISVFVYCSFAMLGYLSFRRYTESDILKMYPDGDIYALIARVMQTLTVCFSYPVVAFALRRGIDGIFFKRLQNKFVDHSIENSSANSNNSSSSSSSIFSGNIVIDNNSVPSSDSSNGDGDDIPFSGREDSAGSIIDTVSNNSDLTKDGDVGSSSDSNSDNDEVTLDMENIPIVVEKATRNNWIRSLGRKLLFCEAGRLVTMSFFLCAFHAVVAIIVGNLGVLLSFSGSFFGTSIVFIFPGMFYLRLSRSHHWRNNISAPHGICRGSFVLVSVVVVIGFALMLLGSTVASLRAAGVVE